MVMSLASDPENGGRVSVDRVLADWFLATSLTSRVEIIKKSLENKATNADKRVTSHQIGVFGAGICSRVHNCFALCCFSKCSNRFFSGRCTDPTSSRSGLACSRGQACCKPSSLRPHAAMVSSDEQKTRSERIAAGHISTKQFLRLDCGATQAQLAALMQQLVAVVNQMAQIEQALQARVETAPPSGSRQTGCATRRSLIWSGTPSKLDDWVFSVMRAIRSANFDAYKLLTHVEHETIQVKEVDMDKQFEGLRMESVSAQM